MIIKMVNHHIQKLNLKDLMWNNLFKETVIPGNYEENYLVNYF